MSALKLNSKAKDCHYWRCNGKDVATIISWNQGMQKCQVFSLDWSKQYIALIKAFVKKKDWQFSNSKMNIQFILWHCCNHCGSSKQSMHSPKKLMWYIFKAKKGNKVNWATIVFWNLAKDIKKCMTRGFIQNSSLHMQWKWSFETF